MCFRFLSYENITGIIQAPGLPFLISCYVLPPMKTILLKFYGNYTFAFVPFLLFKKSCKKYLLRAYGMMLLGPKHITTHENIIFFLILQTYDSVPLFFFIQHYVFEINECQYILLLFNDLDCWHSLLLCEYMTIYIFFC